MVYNSQQAYYEAITESTRQADSGPFIEFMLSEILQTLKSHQGEEIISVEVPNKMPNKVPDKKELQVLNLLKKNGSLTRKQLCEKTGLSDGGIKKIIASLKEVGWIVRIGSNKTGYWEVRG